MPVTVTTTWAHIGDPAKRKPTIYEALKASLKREPTHDELCAEVRRILQDR